MADSDPSIKRTICKRCDTTLIPALTSTVRMKGMKWCKCMHVFTWLTSRLTRPCIHYPLQDMWHRQEVVSRLPSAFFTTIRKHCRKRKQRSNVIKQSCAANQIRLFALFLSFSFPFSLLDNHDECLQRSRLGSVYGWRRVFPFIRPSRFTWPV